MKHSALKCLDYISIENAHLKYNIYDIRIMKYFSCNVNEYKIYIYIWNLWNVWNSEYCI